MPALQAAGISGGLVETRLRQLQVSGVEKCPQKNWELPRKLDLILLQDTLQKYAFALQELSCENLQLLKVEGGVPRALGSDVVSSLVEFLNEKPLYKPENSLKNNILPLSCVEENIVLPE